MERYATTIESRLLGIGAALVMTLAVAGFVDTLFTPDPSPHAAVARALAATEVTIVPSRIEVVGTRSADVAQDERAITPAGWTRG